MRPHSGLDSISIDVAEEVYLLASTAACAAARRAIGIRLGEQLT